MDKYRCFRCNHDLVIDDNWMGSDLALVPDEKSLTDEDFMVTLMSCPHRGASYKVYDTPLSEIHNYPYFNEETAQDSVV